MSGIASLAYFSEEESAESSNQEDEDGSEGGESDHDAEEVVLMDEQLERRSNAGERRNERRSNAGERCDDCVTGCVFGVWHDMCMTQQRRWEVCLLGQATE